MSTLQLMLVGLDPEMRALVCELAGQSGVQIAGVFAAGDEAAALREVLPAAAFRDEWEQLAGGSTADAVLVARHVAGASRMDVVRRLVSAGVPVVVHHPACTVVEGYELEMIRSEVQGLLIGYVPGRGHPALERLANWCRDVGCLGKVEHVVFERPLASRDRASVLRQLARDTELLRAVVGEMVRVSAMGGWRADDELASLNVNMTAGSGLLARWTLLPGGAGATAGLQVVGSLGTATLELRGEPSDWQLVGPDGSLRFSDWNEVADCVARWQAARATGRVDPAWIELCRSLDLAEAAEMSLSRGKTIELHLQQPSEESSFKGMMAAAGCGLLLLTLFCLVTGAIVEGVRLSSNPALRRGATTDAAQPDTAAPLAEPAVRLSIWLRLWPVYPLAAFLLLQLLRLAIRQPVPPVAARSGQLFRSRQV